MNKFVERFGWYGSDWFLENDDGDVAWVTPMVKEHIERIEDENANLREELESVGMAAYLYSRGDLRAENDKLREVCADAWMLLVLSGNDDLVAELTIGKDKRVYDAEEITDRMQELGVEVPEWANSASPTR